MKGGITHQQLFMVLKVSKMKMYICREFKDVRKLKNKSEVRDNDWGGHVLMVLLIPVMSPTQNQVLPYWPI
jgi:hypothetical protein